MDQLAQQPSTSNLTETAFHLETKVHSSLEEATNSIHDRIDDIVNGANQLPAIIGNELRAKLKDVVKTMTSTHDIFIGEILKQKNAIKALNDTILSSNTSLVNQIFEMKNMIREQNTRSDNALALVHQQQQSQEAAL